ncbi:polyprenyl synthetase family protein [Streptomyces sp. NPDC050485]|uniref:polyprenyl synthetase family protein n=1 Tax=Streptomyces sp. NPDC050485 TaxID=3365617 RepID=UPI00378A2510
MTKRWYLHAHLRTASGATYALAIAFLLHEDTQGNTDGPAEPEHCLTYALTDLATGARRVRSWMDRPYWHGIRREIDGDLALDPRVRAALLDLPADRPVRPDRLMDEAISADMDGPRFGFGDVATLRQDGEGAFHLLLRDGVHARLCLRPGKPAITQQHRPGRPRVRFHDGSEAVTLVFSPRLSAVGTLRPHGSAAVPVTGEAWSEQSWTGAWHRARRGPDVPDRAWVWAGLQLDNGWELSVFEGRSVSPAGRTTDACDVMATAVAPDGSATHHRCTWRGDHSWTSLTSLNTYPTSGLLTVPELGAEVTLRAAKGAHEILTLARGRAYREGPVTVQGTMDTRPVTGQGYLEVLPPNTIADFERYIGRATAITAGAMTAVDPVDPGDRQAIGLLSGTDEEPVPLDTGTQQRLHAALAAPVRHLLDNPGRSWRAYATSVVFCLLGHDPEPYLPLAAMTEVLHTGSLIVDDIEDGSPLRRGRPAAHRVFGIPVTINAGTAAYFTFDAFLRQLPALDSATTLRLYRLYLSALRASHAGQALDITGLDSVLAQAVTDGRNALLLDCIRTVHRLKSGVPVRRFAEAAALLARAEEEKIRAIGDYFEAVGTSYQASDDIADLRGCGTLTDHRAGRSAKLPAEDLRACKATLPVAHALGLLGSRERQNIYAVMRAGTGATGIDAIVTLLYECGAVQACLDDTRRALDAAWGALDGLLAPSWHKAMCRALGWYAAQREYDPVAPLSGVQP